MKRIIVTADDFGLAPEINDGIIEACRSGVVTAVSLLMNAPQTEQAIALARAHPEVEVGIHLSVVEGLSLRGKVGTITDERRYFGDELCLHRHWQQFLPRYLAGRIDLGELEEELELQVRRFLDVFPSIPFANGTQHLHVLPGVQDIIVRLARRYGIGAVRIPGGDVRLGGRWVQGKVLGSFGQRLRRKLAAIGVATTDGFWGFDASGRLSEEALAAYLPRVRTGTTEIMTHPGYDCPSLRENLPWGYRYFRWQDELKTVTSPKVRAQIGASGIDLIRFSDLNRSHNVAKG